MMRVLPLLVAALFFVPSIAVSQPGTAFTYQGRLTDGGAPANGTYDFLIRLYDAPLDGGQVGSTVTLNDVQVANGVFLATLDFGAAFDGQGRWLEISVRPGASTGTHSVLAPRQEITPSPLALHAADATTIAGLSCADDQIAKWSTGWKCGLDLDTNTTYAPGTGLLLAGTTFNLDNGVVARKDAAGGSQAFDTNVLFLDYTNNRVGIGTTAPAATLHVAGGVTLAGGTAAADAAGADVSIAAQAGGADGGDGDIFGGFGGSINMTTGDGGTTHTSGGNFNVTVGRGQGLGHGGSVLLTAGTAGSGGGDGGAVALNAGPATVGNGGGVTIAAGSASGGFAGPVTISGGGSVSGTGGSISITAGGTSTGSPGEITLTPGSNFFGPAGAVELGGATTRPNTSDAGAIKVHVVSGDMNFTGAGDGIILRSPDGTVCGLIQINNSGLLVSTLVACP